MEIVTNSGNSYSYIRRSGEIIRGSVHDDYEWTYAPLKPFDKLPNVEYFVISISEVCNLRCTYCCYSGIYANRRIHSSNAMSNKDIDDVYGFIDSITLKRPITIALYGGEPLTYYSVVQYAIVRGLELWGDDVRFSLSTNGALLTEEILEWLIEHNINDACVV